MDGWRMMGQFGTIQPRTCHYCDMLFDHWMDSYNGWYNMIQYIDVRINIQWSLVGWINEEMIY